MNYAEAITVLKEGKRITRSCWQAGTYLVFVPATEEMPEWIGIQVTPQHLVKWEPTSLELEFTDYQEML